MSAVEHVNPGSASPLQPYDAPNESFVRRCRAVAVASAVVVTLAGCTGLAGWIFDLELLKGLFSGGITMKANAALCLLLAGLALFLSLDGRPSLRWPAGILGAVVAIVGGLTFGQHVFGWDLGIDQLMFSEPPGAAGTMKPGRMGPPASLSFLLGGISLLLLDVRTRRGHAPAQWPALGVALIASLPLLGYAYEIQPLYGVSKYTGIAAHTALAIAAFAVGLLAARPCVGLTAILCADDAGGAMARRLLLPAVLIPFALGWLRTVGTRTGLFDDSLGRPLLVISLIIVFTFVIWWNAHALSRLGRERARSQADRDRQAQSVKLLADTTLRLLMEEDPHHVLDGLFRRLSKHLEIEVFFNFLVTEDGRRLRLNACAGVDDGVCDSLRYLEFGQAVCGAVASEGVPRSVEDVQASCDESTALIRSLGITAYACHPLLAHGRLIGTLSFGSRTRTRFSAADLDLMRAASDQIAMALERQRLTDELRRRADELATANAAKDEFLAILSHELRTPLTPVLLTASMMESHPALPAELRDDVAAIRRNVELESRLISDLLDLTRISKGKLQLDVQDVDLHALVRAAIDICQREASANLRVELNAPRHTVRGDGTRLQQVFWNLVSNAIKFTGPGGTITVRSSNGGGDGDGGGLVRVEVIDTGRGIDAAVLPKLFNAFEQGGRRTAREQAGLGLGLAITRKLTEAHGGTVAAHSDGHGRGATFVVELPTVAQPASAVPPEQPESPGRAAQQALSVLLVEDHEPTRNVLTRLLRHSGHTVTATPSVATARAAAQQQKFDLLLSDLGLPDGSGLELMRELRDDYAGRAIALTGYGMEADVRASRDAGFTEHLTKPIDVAVLEAAVHRVTTTPRDTAGANGDVSRNLIQA